MSNRQRKRQFEIQKQRLREKQQQKQRQEHKNKFKVVKKKEWLRESDDNSYPEPNLKNDSCTYTPPTPKPSAEFIQDLESKWDFTEEEDLYFSFSKKQIHLIKKRYYSSRKVR